MPDPEERRDAQTPATAEVPEEARAELALSAGEQQAREDDTADDEEHAAGDDERAPVDDDDRRRQGQAWTASGSLG